MKRTIIVEPIKTTLVSQEPVQSGKRYLECTTATDFTINVIREGAELNSSAPSLYVKTYEGQVGGEPRANLNNIPDGGLVPSSFSNTFNLMYSFNDPLTNKENWIGKKGFGAKHYKNFNISEVSNNFIAIDLDNGYMFEHEGDLFFVAEKYSYAFNNRMTLVNLYKYSESQNTFYLVNQFISEPINTIDTTSVTLPIPKNQYGSPVGLSYNGKIYIAYRVVNNSTGNCHISLYQQIDSNSFNFDKVSETPMLNAPNKGYYDDFRLRLVQGCDILMLVTYGTVRLYRGFTTSYPYCVRDFRTYCSFDGGFNFSTKSQGIQNVLVDPSATFKAITQRSDYNASTLLFPEFISNSNEEDYSSISVKFDLYFDESIGKFVLLKGGDPFAQAPDDPADPTGTMANANNLFLMGICSSPETPFDWESLIKYPLVASNIGYLDDPDGVDPLDPNDLLANSRSDALYIEDVKVVHTLKESYLYMIVRNTSSLGHQDFTTVVTRFRLVNDRYIPKGFYSKIFAYGMKGHNDISFCCDIINPSTSSLYSTGDFNGGFGASTRINATDIMASTYRNQVVATCKTSYDTYSANTVSTTEDLVFGNKQEASRYRFLCFFGPYSNIGDNANYELCWPIAFQRPQYFFGLGENVGSGAVTAYNVSPNGFISFTPSSITDRKYLNIGRSSPYGYENQKTFTERIFDNFADNGFYSFKIKFQAGVFNMTSTNYITVLDVDLNDAPALGIEFQVRMTASGALEVFDGGGFLGGFADGTLTLGQYYDILVAVGFNTQGQTTWGLAITYKLITDDEISWAIPERVSLTPSTGTLTHHFHIGLAGLQTYEAGMRVEIGSVLASSGAQGYSPIFQDLGVLNIAPGESVLNDLSDDNSFIADPIEQVGTRLQLHDGSEIEILGPPAEKQELEFSLKLARPTNSVKNVHSQNSTYGHDFTPYYDFFTKYSLLFLKDNYEPFSSCCMFNLIGVTEINIECGEYDYTNDVFLASGNETFEIPFETITYTDIVDNFIITDIDYKTHELRGKYLYVEESLTVTKQLLIKDNYDGIIEVDEDLSSLMIGAVFKLYSSNVYFDFDTNLNYTTSIGLADTIKVTFATPVIFNSKLRNVGQITFGNSRDFSDLITTFDMKDSSHYSPIKTDRGYSFNTIDREVSLSRTINLNMSSVTKDSNDYKLACDLFSHLKKHKKQFAIVTYDNQNEETVYYGQLESLDINRNGNEKDVSSVFRSKEYKIAPSESTQNAPFIFSYALDSDLSVIDNVTYFCSATGNPGVTYTYTWTLGDGYVFPTSTTTVTYNYANEGTYKTIVEIIGSDGFIGTREFITVVRSPEINAYALTINNAASPKTLTLTARDRNGDIVKDSSTVVELIPVNANALANQYDNLKITGYNGAYNSSSTDLELNDFNTRLQDGLAMWRINPATLTTGLATFRVKDVRDRTFNLSVAIT